MNVKKIICIVLSIAIIFNTFFASSCEYIVRNNSDVFTDLDSCKDNSIYQKEEKGELNAYFEQAMCLFTDRDFQASSQAFDHVIEELAKMDFLIPEQEVLLNKSYLYKAFADIHFEKYYRAELFLNCCNEYFSQYNEESNSCLGIEEAQKLSIYIKLALSHIYVYYEKYDISKEYLNEVERLLNNKEYDRFTKLFYSYESTYFLPDNAENLEVLLENWEKNYTKEETMYNYYLPLMKLMLARAYTKTDPQKACTIIRHDLLSQEAPLGTTAKEKMRILADTYDVYADCLESLGLDQSHEKIISYRKIAASLYDSLMLVHYNRICVDEVYYKQVGISHYKLAVAYSSIGQTQTAIIELEHALDYLRDVQPDAHIELCKALALGEELYRHIGDCESEKKYIEELEYYKNNITDFF